MPVPCSRCAKNMSATAVVCPHCGARQSDRDPVAANAQRRATSRDDGVAVDPYRGQPAERPKPEADEPKPLELSPDEARALLEVKGLTAGALEYERPTGPLVLVVPRAEATGGVRTLEWTLTILALPIVVLGFFPAFASWRTMRYLVRGSEWTLTAAVGISGALTIHYAGGWLLGMSEPVQWGLLALSGGALLGRAILRVFPAR